MTEYNDLVREFCAANGVSYVPVAEELSGGIDSFVDICHLRMPGIGRKAAIVFEHIKDVVAQRLGAVR